MEGCNKQAALYGRLATISRRLATRGGHLPGDCGSVWTPATAPDQRLSVGRPTSSH
jgi:hypothetical protein